MARGTAAAATDDSSAFRDDYMAYSQRSTFSSSSLLDGKRKANLSAAPSIWHNAYCSILESRDSGSDSVDLTNENEYGRVGLVLPPPPPLPTPPSKETTMRATPTKKADPLREILAGYNRLRHTPPPPPRPPPRPSTGRKSSSGHRRDDEGELTNDEEGVEVTVEAYSTSPLLRRSQERALERKSLMEEMRRTSALIPHTKGKFGREEAERTVREYREERREEDGMAAIATTTSRDRDEPEPPRTRSLRMKKLWDFDDVTRKDDDIDDCVNDNGYYQGDLNPSCSNDIDIVVRTKHGIRYDYDDIDVDDGGGTLSSSRIRREYRRILTRQARDDLVEVEKFAKEMKGKMEGLRQRQPERETIQVKDDGGRSYIHRERVSEREQIVATTIHKGTNNSNSILTTRKDAIANNGIESLVCRFEKAATVRSPPTIRGSAVDTSKAADSNEVIGDGVGDTGQHSFRESKGGVKDKKNKLDRAQQRPSQQQYDARDFHGQSKSMSSQSGLDNGRCWVANTKREHRGDSGSSSGMDDRLESWWKMQQLRKRKEQQRGADFEELAGEPTIEEADSHAPLMTCIGHKQDSFHRGRISDGPPLSPPSTSTSSSPCQKGAVSDATYRIPPSALIAEESWSSLHESFRSSGRSRYQEQTNAGSDMDRSRIRNDDIRSGSIASSSRRHQSTFESSEIEKYVAIKSSDESMNSPMKKNEHVLNYDSIGSKKVDSGDRVAGGSTLSVLLKRIEETKSNLTKALLEGDVVQQKTMATLMTTLGEAAVTLRKLESTGEISN